MNCRIFEITKRIIASKVSEVRKMSCIEKNICSLVIIERKINITTLNNATGGVIMASMKRATMNIEINVRTLR